MTDVVFYFQVHQPYRLLRRDTQGTAPDAELFDVKENRRILRRVADRCYVPMNTILLDLIEETEGAFKCSFSLSGTVLKQLEDWAPDALDTFVALARTGSVEFLCETSSHSLASQGDLDEFEDQVLLHRGRIEDVFGQQPTTFRNTELIIDEKIAERVEALGFDALLGEGFETLLDGMSPRQVYRVRGTQHLKLLLRDYLFSDDIAFRFSNRDWPQYPLMADTFAEWLHKAPPEDRYIGLFMDYETFGEHQDESTGVLEFMRHMPAYYLTDERFGFATPAEVAKTCQPVAELTIPRPVSWADAERDVSAWLANPLQREAHAALYALLPEVRKAGAAGYDGIVRDWRKLTTSDHVYYMCTKVRSDGDVHEYFTPYESPHDSFVLFMRALDDLRARTRAAVEKN